MLKTQNSMQSEFWPAMSRHDMAASTIIETLREMECLAKDVGESDMADAIRDAFDTCLALHVAKKEEELRAKLHKA